METTQALKLAKIVQHMGFQKDRQVLVVRYALQVTFHGLVRPYAWHAKPVNTVQVAKCAKQEGFEQATTKRFLDVALAIRDFSKRKKANRCAYCVNQANIFGMANPTYCLPMKIQMPMGILEETREMRWQVHQT
jgi:hypothetical protein